MQSAHFTWSIFSATYTAARKSYELSDHTSYQYGFFTFELLFSTFCPVPQGRRNLSCCRVVKVVVNW